MRTARLYELRPAGSAATTSSEITTFRRVFWMSTVGALAGHRQGLLERSDGQFGVLR
jgi:hypothetical protein